MLKVKAIDLFYGASQALRHIDVTAKAGAVTCVLGRNGVGKTSLLRSIVGQERVQSVASNGMAARSPAWLPMTELPPGLRWCRRGVKYFLC